MTVWVLLFNEGGYEGQTSIEAVFRDAPKPDDVRPFVGTADIAKGRLGALEDRLWRILTTGDDIGWDGGYWVEEHEVKEAKA